MAQLPTPVQQTLLAKKARFFVIDATKAAREAGLAGRTNTVLQTCFFALSGVLPRDEAIEKIKASIRATYRKKGEEVVRKNFEAVDTTLAQLHEVSIPDRATSTRQRLRVVPEAAPNFVQKVTAAMIGGTGNDLPVSLLPNEGAYPSGTTQWEKRNVADFIPVWESELCIQCGNCSFVCPHSVIRSRYYDQASLEGAPDGFRSAPLEAVGLPDTRYTLQVYVEDCTGCGLCVEVCPAKDKATGVKALVFAAQAPLRDQERTNFEFFLALPDEPACQAVRSRLETDGFSVDAKPMAEKTDLPFSLHASKSMRLIVPDMQDLTQRFTALAAEFGGRRGRAAGYRSLPQLWMVRLQKASLYLRQQLAKANCRFVTVEGACGYRQDELLPFRPVGLGLDAI